MLLPKQRLPTCRQMNLDKTLKGRLGKLQESQLKGRGMIEKMSGRLFLDHVIGKLPCLWEEHLTLWPQVTRVLCVRGSGIFLIRTVIFCSDSGLCNMYRIAGNVKIACKKWIYTKAPDIFLGNNKRSLLSLFCKI